MGRVFANDPEDRGSIPGQVIPRTQKWYLIPPCLTLRIIRYVSRVRWGNPGKGLASSPTPRCSSCWKGSLQVTLDYRLQHVYRYEYMRLHWIYGYAELYVQAYMCKHVYMNIISVPVKILYDTFKKHWSKYNRIKNNYKKQFKTVLRKCIIKTYYNRIL